MSAGAREPMSRNAKRRERIEKQAERTVWVRWEDRAASLAKARQVQAAKAAATLRPRPTWAEDDVIIVSRLPDVLRRYANKVDAMLRSRDLQNYDKLARECVDAVLGLKSRSTAAARASSFRTTTPADFNDLVGS